ncbi:PREDICTED: uncharacterized protein LOC109213827 [Nicotiana attenuata]|uniref:uncharacterized protein LOC109213827 n=1 Tax=Nicotiana attenuata TaxID=49451 RepID=UPI0009049B6C|nr:PREDICTED: uncharacterized protein LOC109213827 [Nicotiana attenuata]
MPDIPKYDGTLDSQEHITTYTMVVKGNDLAQHEIESILLKKFWEILMKVALTWYSLLPDHSNDSFEILAELFIKAYVGARKFQKERMLLPAVPDEWASGAFTKGLNPLSSDAFRKLKESLLEIQATTWADVHNRYESKIRIKYDQLGSSASSKGRNRDRNQDKFKSDLMRIGVLVPVIRNIKEARFPKPILSDPSQKDPNLWYEFHENHGHRTGDCRHIREEVATLLKNGHLREFLSDRAKNNCGKNRDVAEPSKPAAGSPCMTINMIFSGEEANGVIFLATKKTKLSVTHGKRIRKVLEDDITFTEEDDNGFLLPYNDA